MIFKQALLDYLWSIYAYCRRSGMLVLLMSLWLLSSTANAAQVNLLNSSSVSAMGAGATGTPNLSNFNIPAGKNRVLFIFTAFERDHCDQLSDTCLLPPSESPVTGLSDNYSRVSATNQQITARVIGSGATINKQNALVVGGSPSGDTRFSWLESSLKDQFGVAIPNSALFTADSYHIALFESEINSLLGGASTGTVSISLPDMPNPKSTGDDALIMAFVLENADQTATGLVRSALPQLVSPGTGIAGNYTLNAASFDAGQAPNDANDGLLVIGVSSLGQPANPGGFLPMAGYTQILSLTTSNANGRYDNSEPTWTTTEPDGFSASAQFRNGIVSSYTLQSAAASSVIAWGGWAPAFTISSDNADTSDAPSTYGSSTHTLSGIRLGASVDADSIILANATATGDDTNGTDDENGVTIPATLTASVAATIPVSIQTAAGYLNAWIDWNQDGDFLDAGEQVATERSVAIGTTNLSVTPPATASTGTTFARFRVCTNTSLCHTPTSVATSGEVEDYQANVIGVSNKDYGDAPATYGTPTHTIVAGISLGTPPDTEVAQPTPQDGTGDDVTGTDDEGDVTFLNTAFSGGTITASVTGAGGYLQGWIDWNRDGDFLDANEQVAANLQDGGALDISNASGEISFRVTAPAGYSSGTSYARFRWSTTNNLTPTGNTSDGEVEDYPVTLVAQSAYTCPSSGGTGGYATSGAGLYKNDIFWFDWSCGARTQFNPGDTVTKTWTLPNGAVVTGVITSITDAMSPYNSGSWSGDLLDNLYSGVNPVGLKNTLENQTSSPDPTFNINFTTTLNGTTISPGFVMAEAEDLDNANESFKATTDGDKWQPIEGSGTISAQFSADGKTITTSDTSGSMGSLLIAASSNAQNLSVVLGSGGTSAAAFGTIIPFDYSDAPTSYGLPSHYVQRIFTGGSQPNTLTALSGLTMATATLNTTQILGTIIDSESTQTTPLNGTGDNATGTNDEDGTTLPGLSQGQTTSISIKVVGTGYLQAWFDWNSDGDFADAGEQVATNLQDNGAGDTNTVAGTVAFNVSVPSNAATTATYARLRWSTTSGLSSTALAANGEVEDYALTITAALNDYSDAPATYGTPNHTIVAGVRLGTAPDAESAASTPLNGTGDDVTGTDDEGGVSIPTLTKGQNATITATVTGAGGYLQGWIDWNGNGTFEVNEQVAPNLQDNGTGDLSTLTGTISFAVSVPTYATGSATYARFRWSTTSNLDSTSAASDGEVEDYALTISAASAATDSACTVSTQGAANGSTFAWPGTASTVTVNTTNNWSATATNLLFRDLANFNRPLKGANRWDKAGDVTLTLNFSPAVPARELVLYINDIGYSVNEASNPTVTFSISGGAKVSDFVMQPLASGATTLAYIAASGTILKQNPIGTSREHGVLVGQGSNLVSQLSLTTSGIIITDFVAYVLGANLDCDFGDAPDTAGAGPAAGDYATLGASNGPQHQMTTTPNVYLGAGVSTEQDALVNATATGDADNGVTLPTLSHGQTATISATVTGTGGSLQGWIDWNGDGDFVDPSEQVATNLQDNGTGDTNPIAGTIAFNTTVPATAVTTQTFARFRWSTTSGLNSTALAMNGEIEDYALTVSANIGLSGVVFEDVNYGGGAGRSQATSSGVGVSGAKVELYNSAGALVTTATTAADGSYNFNAAAAGTYYVRVVSDTVNSTRTGSTGAELAVQTYRTDATTAVTNEIGGRTPSLADSTVNSGTDTLNTSTFKLASGAHVQSLQAVTLSSGGASGINFGFNFDTIVNTNDSGQGSLRQFILNSNLLQNTGLAQSGLTAGYETSIFQIPGTAPFTIAPTSALAAITDSYTAVDASTQAGTSCAASARTLAVQLDGTGAGANMQGLTVSADHTLIRGLSIGNYTESGIYATATGTNLTVQCNNLGLRADGSTLMKNTFYGLYDNGGANLTVGGTSTADRNIISGNGKDGVRLYAVNTALIQNNYIGTTAAGTAALSNNQEVADYAGIMLTGAALATGSKTITITDNVISGNDKGVANTTNTSKGIKALNASLLTITNNRIGTTPDGMTALLNTGYGIFTQSATDIVIGGTTAAERNIISGNQQDGINTRFGTNRLNIYGNYIGFGSDGVKAIGNANNGIFLADTSNALIGNGAASGRNIIGNNSYSGIRNSTSTGTKIADNYLGTDVSGTLDKGNTLHGAYVQNSNDVVVGGSAATDANLIVYNKVIGVFTERVLPATATTNTLVENNYIGILKDGETAAGNTQAGVETKNNTGVTVRNNTISANKTRGVHVVSSPTTTIVNNRIGTNASGTSDKGNLQYGIDINVAAAGLTINGNLVSGNDMAGIRLINGDATGSAIYDNKVGTNLSGTAALANTLDGVIVDSTPNATIGSTSGSPNTISGNSRNGILISGTAAQTVQVVGNLIGLNSAGTSGIANTGQGVLVQAGASNISIGDGTSAGANKIAYNGDNGIGLSGTSTTNVRISRNSLYANAVLGIDLGLDKVSLDDANDSDTGANSTLNFPIFNKAQISGTNLIVSGCAPAGSKIELFEADVSPSSTSGQAAGANKTTLTQDYGEGESYLATYTEGTGEDAVTFSCATLTAADGNSAAGMSEFQWTMALPSSLVSTDKITATATVSGIGTSEFSAIAALSNQTYDYSDAPATYGSAGHGITTGTYLGSALPDAESAAQPNATATGDDVAGSDDEEGITLPATIISLASSGSGSSGSGSTSGSGIGLGSSITVSAAVAGTNGKLQAWIDWNKDGDFDDAGEQVATDLIDGDSLDTNPAANAISFVVNVPTGLTGGDTFARFRWSTVAGLTPSGIALDGEVEDYKLTISSGNNLSGRVFEDMNYGGGAGRSLSTSSGAGVNGVTVELYNSTGTLVGTTTTANDGTNDGAYSFPSTAAGDYFVRVVSDTVNSTRAGSTGAELAIQTFRTDGTTPVINEVGGRTPSLVDGLANTGTETLDSTTLKLSGGGHVQSLQPVTVAATDVTGVDFGYNFDTIVNTNEFGQGSLRQFILNANLLGNTGLDQEDIGGVTKDAGWEHSIFHIPTTDAGYLTDNLTGSNGTAFIIRQTTALPEVTGAQTAIDGRTQTAYTGDTNPAVALISRGPEVIIDYQGLVGDRVIGVNGAQFKLLSLGTVRADDPSTGSYIGAGALIVGANLNGSLIDGLTAVGNGDAGIMTNDAAVTGLTIQNSTLRNNGVDNFFADGLGIAGGSNILVENNEMINNAAFGIDFIPSFAISNITIRNNIVTGNGATGSALQQGGIGVRHGNGALIENNTIYKNTHDGIVVLSGKINVVIRQNSLYDNGQLGIDLSANTTSSGDEITLNDANDADTGGNNRLNFPLFKQASLNGGNLTISGCAPAGSTIELFEADVSPTSTSGVATGANTFTKTQDYGEGERYLASFIEGTGEDVVTTSIDCATLTDTDANSAVGMSPFQWTFALPSGVVLSDKLTATTTVTGTGTSEFSAVAIVSNQAYDYGDAPTTYGDAWHTIVTGTHLGAVAPDVETGTGTPQDGTGDNTTGTNDEESALFYTPFSGGTIMIKSAPETAGSNPGAGYLQAWIDWNRDGDFNDAGEQIATDLIQNGPLDTEKEPTGTHAAIAFMVTPPASYSAGASYLRVRWSSQAGLGPTGGAPDGEVEDYPITLASPVVHNCPASNGNGGYAIAGTGLYKDELFWLDWSCGTTTEFNVGDTVNKSWTLANGTVVTAQITEITDRITPVSINVVGTTGTPAASLKDEYAIAGGAADRVGLANYLYIPGLSTDPQFKTTFSVTINGVPVPPHIATAESERIDGPREAFTATTSGLPWEILEGRGSINATFSSDGKTVVASDTTTTAPSVLVFSSEETTDTTLTIRGAGRSSAALAVVLPFDYSDAPATFGSPSHYLARDFSGSSRPTSTTALAGLTMATAGYDLTTYLGSNILDTELNSQPTPTADGDDANGVDDENSSTLPSFSQGQTATISTTVTGVGGYLQAWFDWNGDGDFTDAGEQVATDVQDNSTSDTNPVAGTLAFNVTVPNNAVTTPTFARLRWSTIAGLTSTALAANGEVEDYALTIIAQFEPELPNAVCTMNAYGWADTHTPLGTGGGELNPPYSLVTGSYDWNSAGNPIWLGSSTPTNTSLGVAVNTTLAELDMTDSSTGQNEAWMTITRLEGNSGSAGTAIIQDGGALEHKVFLITDTAGNVLTRYPSAASTSTNTTVTPPGERNLSGLVLNFTYPSDGVAYVHVYTADYSTYRNVPYVASCLKDYGDAPASYGSPAHTILEDIQLGTIAPDIDAAPQANAAADGDDTAGTDDEDGVTLPAEFNPSQLVAVSVNVVGVGAQLQAWIDWNGDGDFADKGEQIAKNVADNAGVDMDATAGVLTFNVTPPATAKVGNTYARFRWSTQSNLNATVAANDGEVEDYAITIAANGTPLSIAGRVFNDVNVDGVDNTETGIKDVTIVLLDTTTNTCQSTRTNAQGGYEFADLVAGDYQVYEAFGAKVPTPTTCPPTAKDPNGYVSSTSNNLAITLSTTAVNDADFGDVRTPSFSLDNSKAILPNSTVTYPHVFQAYADGNVLFNIDNQQADPADLTWGATLFLDANCDAKLGQGDTPITAPLAVNAGDKLCILTKVAAPANAPTGALHVLTVSSDFQYGDASLIPASNIQTHTDRTQTSAGSNPEEPTKPSTGEGKLSLEKSVWNVTRNIDGSVALPGETLRYTIHYENIGNGLLDELVIQDSVPEFTQLVPASMAACGTILPELSACTPQVNGTGLQWIFTGKLKAGSQGEGSYEVIVE
ncbi:MAG: CshA/CshB family fibrillar adhesin-related protein [Thiolinea sp.]